MDRVDCKTLNEIIHELEQKYDVEFTKDAFDEEAYISHPTKKEDFIISIKHYKTGDEKDGKPFISVGYHNKKELYGYGYPCDTFEEVCSLIDKYHHFKERTQMSLFDEWYFKDDSLDDVIENLKNGINEKSNENKNQKILER